MSETLKDRMAAMLADLRSHPMQPPRVERDGHHVVVKGSHDPLRQDFASSGKEGQRASKKYEPVPAG